ncbi:MAG: hypothetical protein RLZZ241_1320 [Bacteroidota bacterium]|jgi:hypothetical protein
MLKKLKNRAKNGLLLHTLRNGLALVGLDFEPYWLYREGLDLGPEPGIKDDSSLYTMRKIDDQVIRDRFALMGWNTGELEFILSLEHFSFGLYRESELTAFMIGWVNKYPFKNKLFTLKPNEAYLDSMFTFDAFRGRNLAPFLRYKAYEILAVEGYTDCYSITQYFNKSSRRFKEKLNAYPIAFYLYFNLFRRFSRNLTLKKYKNRQWSLNPA